MEIVLNIQTDGKLQDEDIIIRRKGKWVAISKSRFLSDVLDKQKKVNESLAEDIGEIRKDLSKLAKIVKEK